MEQTLRESIQEAVGSQKKYFKSGQTRSLKSRLDRLKRFVESLRKYQSAFETALHQDLGKSGYESYMTEIGLVYEEAAFHIRHLKKWMKKKSTRTPLNLFPSKSRIYPEPLGTVLIISPWNYPVNLSLMPLIGAVSAGNTVVLKPSRYSSETTEVMEKIIRTGFQTEEVALFKGGREMNQLLLREKFDYIFFTGSPAVGKIVMKSAAEFLTPVTLELGGKSPALVHNSADIQLAAKKIAWGKTMNTGQTCIAPDYVLVDRKNKDQLISEIIRYFKAFYTENAMESPDYGRIINQKHFERLNHLISGNILYGGKTSEKELFISPTIIDIPLKDCDDHPAMNEEIFGPVLPVIAYEDWREALNFILARPKPLALYLFSQNQSAVEEVLSETSSGGVCINDTLVHLSNPGLPFGGVGQSGMGQYHGRYSFDTFTHYKSVLEGGKKPDISVKYPPYSDQKRKQLEFFLN